MRLTCAKEDLAGVLSAVGRATSTKSTVPVLGNILVEAKDGNGHRRGDRHGALAAGALDRDHRGTRQCRAAAAGVGHRAFDVSGPGGDRTPSGRRHRLALERSLVVYAQLPPGLGVPGTAAGCRRRDRAARGSHPGRDRARDEGSLARRHAAGVDRRAGAARIGLADHGRDRFVSPGGSARPDRQWTEPSPSRR